MSGRRRLVNCCSVLKPSCSSTERPGAPEPTSPGARTPPMLPFSRCDQTVAPDLGPWGALGPVPVGGPSPRAFRRLSRARTRPAGTGGANRYMNRHHTRGCSKMGSIPATPSESARHTSASLGVAALKGLPTLFRVGPGVLRPVSDSGGTYEFSRKTRTNGCCDFKREVDKRAARPLPHGYITLASLRHGY